MKFILKNESCEFYYNNVTVTSEILNMATLPLKAYCKGICDVYVDNVTVMKLTAATLGINSLKHISQDFSYF